MITLILAGGVGTRLFPLSRELFPKQFIPLFDNETLFQKAVKCALLFSKPDGIIIVTSKNHVFLVRDQLSGLCEGCTVLAEPEGKNTLPAITYGILEAYTTHGSESALVLPSDQYMEITSEFTGAVQTAETLANEYLVTFGISPTSAHTGYGYIKPGITTKGGFRVDRFIEKPDRSTAEKYLAHGYLWNSGMFLFSPDMFMEELRLHAPGVAEAFTHPIDEAYRQTPAVSIDYGLLEKTSRAAVVLLNTPWNDFGSFDTLYNVMPKDANGNAVKAEFIPIESHGNLIISDRLVTTVSISDLAIIDTKDVLFVGQRHQSQNVRAIVDLLKKVGDERAILHTTVHRPWGNYTLLEKGRFYLIKRITVLPKRQLSFQLHHHRSEHWVIVQGTAEVLMDGKTILLHNGESTFVPTGMKHRLKNAGFIPLEIIEVQLGEYIGEDDIMRFDDDFGRK